MTSTSYPRGVTGWFRRLPLTLKLVTVLVAVVVGFLVLLKLLSIFNYSTGIRTGTLDKLSSKGTSTIAQEFEIGPGGVRVEPYRHGYYRHGYGRYGYAPDCRTLRRACLNKEELGETGEGNCARYRRLCR